MSYAETRSRADDALGRKGQSLTLTYVGGGSYDPATGTTSGSAASPATVKGAILPLNPFKKNGTTIIEGDQQLLLSALNTSGTAITAPMVNGTITDANSKVWTIIAVEPLSPAGTDVLYDCIVRRQA
jgi:hypothetical protein